ncbi:MAG TPA: phage Gp37/Gp68 family protein [Gemmatimonadaceae bacterium]|nr:phage Gp37/Gp68 family protein [Gemmatimonadaceae bacterium]
MGTRTGIEWTDATWNPVTGCTKVTAGCDHCYAHVLAHRRLRDVYLKAAPVRDTPEARRDPFAVRLWRDRVRAPLSWTEPRMVFVNSMSDLFHQDVPDEFVTEIFEVMLTADRHVYQVLTKRPARAARFWSKHAARLGHEVIPPHIWIGASVESQDVAYRVRHLADVPADVRFLSCEPLLGPLLLDLSDIHWVIVGGESGGGFRPMDRDWARSIRDQCLSAGVPFFFKQWGGHTPKAGGNRLDRRVWRQYPEVHAIGAGT